MSQSKLAFIGEAASNLSDGLNKLKEKLYTESKKTTSEIIHPPTGFLQFNMKTDSEYVSGVPSAEICRRFIVRVITRFAAASGGLDDESKRVLEAVMDDLFIPREHKKCASDIQYRSPNGEGGMAMFAYREDPDHPGEYQVACFVMKMSFVPAPAYRVVSSGGKNFFRSWHKEHIVYEQATLKPEHLAAINEQIDRLLNASIFGKSAPAAIATRVGAPAQIDE
jgi:hypothetical protein